MITVIIIFKYKIMALMFAYNIMAAQLFKFII